MEYSIEDLIEEEFISDQSKKEKTAANKSDPTTDAALLGLASLGVASGVVPAASTIPLAAGVIYSLIKKYRSLPVNKNTAHVEAVSDTWKTRPKANMIKWLMKQSGTSLESVAEHLGCSVSYLNNKLNRDSFSLDDLILAAYACGYSFVLVKNDELIDYPAMCRLDLLEYFRYSDPEVLKRINAIEEGVQKARREEYEQKKAELERMKKEYGFED